MSGKKTGGSFAHKANAECENNALERYVARGIYACHDFLCRFLASSVTVYLTDTDVVEVGDVVYKALAIVVVHGFRSERIDVHCAATDEVLDAPLYLRWAATVIRTVVGGLTLDAH